MRTLSNSTDETQRQRLLPFEWVPEKVKVHGLRDAHPRPLVSLGKRNGIYQGSFRVAPAEAWGFPEIELRAGNTFPQLILDLDSQDALQEYYRRTHCESWPECHWMVQRVVNGHTHAAYNLAVPVHRGELAREKPLRAFARIAEYYTTALKADRGYMGVLTHNPMSKAHGPGFKTQWLRKDPYSLGELARVIPFGWKRPRVSCTDIGRNWDLFKAVQKWAGSEANAGVDVLPAAMAANQQFDSPLPPDEVRGIAKSVERYRARWIAKGKFYTPKQKTLWGRERGIRSGTARRKGTAGRDKAIVQAVESGRSLRDVGREYGLTAEGVRWICKRGV